MFESYYDLAGRVRQTVHKRVDSSVEETRVFTYGGGRPAGRARLRA